MNTAINIEDLRASAKKRLPKSIFEFIDGGAQDEITLTNNNRDLRSIYLVPRVLTDITKRSQETTILGFKHSSPFILAPTGLAGLLWNKGEIGAAKAARNKNIPYCLSTVATCSIEEITESAPAPHWFQLYVLRDRGLTREFINRAKATNCGALVVTVDTKLQGAREKDIRNGFVVPPKFTARTIVDFIVHWRWLFNVAMGRKVKYRNFENTSINADSVMSITEFIRTQWDLSVSWNDIAWFKEQWEGPLLIKGILSPEDAKKAESIGVDGVIVSNHGGRQLDGAISAIKALPKIKAQVDENFTVILDGGIRRGSDIVKAMALGASACMLGRPWLYGLAAAGQTGVERSIDILTQEIDLTMGLLGIKSLKELSPQCLSFE